MSGEERQHDDWKPCPMGLLVQAARGDRAKVSRRKLLRAGGTAAAVFLAGGLGWRKWINAHPQPDGTQDSAVAARIMKCQEAHDLLPSYVKGELTAETQRRMEEHLKRCPHCREERTRLANLPAST